MDKIFAFIDSRNLHLSILSLGWKLDFQRFRVYLREKYTILGGRHSEVFEGRSEQNEV